MVFSSFLFLFLFLPLTCAVYFLLPKRAGNSVLLLASLLFYSWGAPNMLLPLLLSCSCDFLIARQICPGRHNLPWRKGWLTVALLLNISLLAYYKYTNFFVEQLNLLLSSFGADALNWPSIVLPIGISFFTFHKISYLVDVFRGKVRAARSLCDYILYVVLFPQLVAGPIIRYADVANEIVERRSSIDQVVSGIFRFAVGLAKKVLIADAMGSVADAVFGLEPAMLDASWAWIGILAYSFQIYFDFSGYSDMAIGLGWIFGFHFKENFARPYLSRNITEFWHRWHISLSSFMREYLYIPLGGNQGSRLATYRNLWIVFLISGLWHGAAWNFVIWGLFHGFFLVLDKMFWLRYALRFPAALNIGLTFFVVMMGWVLFRAESLSVALHYYQVLFGIQGPTIFMPITAAELIDNRAVFVMFVAALMCFVPRLRIEPVPSSLPQTIMGAIVHCATILLLLTCSAAFLASRGYTPFLYFRF